MMIQPIEKIRRRVVLPMLAAFSVVGSASAETFVFPIVMDGSQETPGAGDADGFANGTLTIDSTSNVISWNFTFGNIVAPTMMHIHTGAAGVAGPVLINMGVATSGGPGTLIGQTPASAANITNILANPQNFYVNIHNAPFPGGAVRGQIPKVFPITLSGAQEAPGPGDPDGSGAGTVWFDTGVKKVFWNLTYANIDEPTAFHVHSGAFGTPGPVFVDLGVATSGGPGTLVGDVATSSANLNAIIAAPENHYLNVHTAPFPAGAIRGQLILPEILGDINGDGSVNAADLAILLGQWGGKGSADLDGDGQVGASDLAILLGAWN